jgi:hypothetical protein
VVVDGARNQFLPGAAFTLNQDAGACLRHALYKRQQFPHRGTRHDGVHAQEVSEIWYRSVHFCPNIFSAGLGKYAIVQQK